MKTKFAQLIGAVVATAALASPALAELQMPANVKPLPEHLLKEIYAGKTLDFGDFRYFYKKNGEISGFSDAPLSFAEGSWTLDKNHFCVDVVWKSDQSFAPYPFSACYDWYTDTTMTTYWTRITASSDPTLVGNVYQGNPSVVREGDAVTRLANKAVETLGY